MVVDAGKRPEGTFQRAPGVPRLPATPFRFVCYFVNQFRWWYLSMVGFETLAATSAILIPYALSKIIKTVSGAQGHSQALVDGLRGPILLFFAFSIGEVVFSRCAGGLQFRFGPKQRQNVTRQMYRYLQAHSHRFLTDNFAGSLAHRIGETSMGVSQTLWAIITDFWPITITLSVSIVLLYQAHYLLAAFVAAWAVLFVGLSYLLARRAQSLAWKASAARSETTGQIVDSVGNLVSTKLFARLDFEREQLDGTLARELKAVRTSNRYTERVRWFQFSAAAVLKVGVLYFALTLWGKGAISVADFVMAVSLSLLIINEARNLSRRFLEFFEFIGNVANGVSTIVRPHELIDGPDAVSPVIQAGGIRFQNVTFSYAPDRPVFDGVDLTIPPGQRVGLVGFSGSGKSTFVSILLRLYDLDSGRILIDGHDIRKLKQDSLHAQIGLIPQDPTLFHRSLRENIRYGKIEATDAEVEAAARQAHADEFIARLKEGYDAMVGERGVKLSGGQRQRIAIARVVLKNAPILILDEATSSLDSVTEKAIQETLDQAMLGKTVLVIAHRLSTISNLDRILVFDQGRIVEDGAHENLIARRGAYWRLWKQQSHGFLPADGADVSTGPAFNTQKESIMSLRQAHLQTPRGTLPYLFKPASQAPGAPLVVFLHGAKDRGDDLSKLLAWGFPKFAASAHDLPYHWLALQIPEGATWPQWQDELFSLVDILRPENSPVKVVLAGFSLGSAGAWQIADANPDRVSGLVIVSGRLPESITPVALARLRNVPTWIFHGDSDDKAPVSQAIETYEILRKIGTPSRLSLIADGEHFIADQVYSSTALQQWLASDDKASFPAEPGAQKSAQDALGKILAGNVG